MKPINAVIVFLYDDDNSYLFQLRDNKPTIIFPNHWGFFGGEIKEGETPSETAARDLKEEIQYVPKEIFKFRKYQRQDVLQGKLRDYCIHAYYGKRTIPLTKLILHEGADLGAFSVDEILTGQLFSDKWNKYFPITPPLTEFFHDYLHYNGIKIENKF